MGFPAARLMDNHLCPMVTPGLPPIPHVGGPISGPCVPTVLIGSMPAATLGDMCVCVGPPDSIIKGSFSVLIGGKPAARVTDNCAHGGMIVMGCPTVLIGDAPSPSTVMGMQASAKGAPFCEICNALAAANADAPMPNNTPLAGPSTQNNAKPKKTKKPKSPLSDKKVAKLISKSPTLKDNIATLQKDGWTIKYGEAGKGSFCSRDDKSIVLDPNDKEATSVVQTLAHESGHALYTPDPYIDYTGLTKNEYVSKNANSALKDEGEATLTNAKIRQEIIDNKGPDIGIAGAQSSKYAEVYDKYEKDGDREKARQEIADIFADNERPSTNPKITYREYYSETYQKHYDKYAKTP